VHRNQTDKDKPEVFIPGGGNPSKSKENCCNAMDGHKSRDRGGGDRLDTNTSDKRQNDKGDSESDSFIMND
jgi:hypothetical protein